MPGASLWGMDLNDSCAARASGGTATPTGFCELRNYDSSDKVALIKQVLKELRSTTPRATSNGLGKIPREEYDGGTSS